MAKEKFIIIDGNAILHRSFHALPPLTTKNGEMINAVYGFTMTLLKAIKDLDPKYIVVTFDKAAPTFRHEMYEKYKGTRIKVEGIEELYNQMPKLKEILRAFHIPVHEKAGFEADDIIGTIAQKISTGNNIPANEKLETIIVTGDLDTLQLINDSTKVYTLKKGLSETLIYDTAQVEERFEGLRPDQMIDYKALRGDPSDNIPGVKGIGEKGAIKLLKQFDTIENLYQKLANHDDFLPEKLANKLIEHKDDALLSKKLATIVKDAPINFRFKECQWKGYDKQRIFDLFQEYEFRSLLNKLPDKIFDADKKEMKAQATKEEHKYILLDTKEKFENFLNEISKQGEIIIDTETTSRSPVLCDLLGISFCWKEGVAYYLPTNRGQKHNSAADGEKSVPLLYTEKKGEVYDSIRIIFENSTIKKCGHNIKYDLIALNNCGINIKGINFDTMIASYLLNPGSRAHSLDDLSFTELGYKKIPIEDLIGKGKDEINMSAVDVKRVCAYSCEDADYTFRLMKKLSPKLEEADSMRVFSEIEIPLIPVLAEMEINGVKIDAKFLNDLAKKMNKEKKRIEEKIFALAGCEFNISSPVQLKEVLFDKLEIPVKNIKKGKTGLSTAASELEKMRGIHPIIDLISDYREFSKLISTYVEALPKLVNEKTGRIHTSFNQTITATGRLSSSNPNLQNIPIRTELGKSIREAFVAPKGYKLLSADYSQIELRIIASLAKDEKMIKAFKANKDIHISTASEIFKIAPEAVTPNMRRQAKAINFGIMYGMGPRGLADGTDITVEEAQNFIDEYFVLYKDIKKFIDQSLLKAHKEGYAETFFGRRRYLPEIASGSPFIRSAAERMAVNHPIQGTAADLIKLAMIKVNEKLHQSSLDAKMILQIHDELLFEIRADKVEEAKELIRDAMENVVQFAAPIKVDIDVGDNWGEI